MGYDIPSRAFGDVTGSMGLYRDIGTNRATTSSAGCWATTSGAGKSREPASGYGVAGSTVVDFGSAPTKARDKVSTGPESATLALIGEVVGVHRPANIVLNAAYCPSVSLGGYLGAGRRGILARMGVYLATGADWGLGETG